MGICAHKKDLEEVDLPSLPVLIKQSAKRHITQHLIDLNKARHVPLLSLAKNSLYCKRLKEQKSVHSSASGFSQMQTLDPKLGAVL